MFYHSYQVVNRFDTNIDKPDYVQFHNFLDIAQGEQRISHYPEIYGAYTNTQHMFRKEGFKLLVYPNIEKVLFFYIYANPNEMRNLADILEYRIKVKTLFENLVELQKTMNDTLDLHSIYDKTFSEP